MDITSNELVEVALSADMNNNYYTFRVAAYVKDEIKVGSKKVDVPVLQEKYPSL